MNAFSIYKLCLHEMCCQTDFILSQPGNNDYVSVSPTSLEFGPMSSSEIEIEVFILSDNITEDAEQFIAQLESSDSAVRLSTSSANITIVDTSGKY